MPRRAARRRRRRVPPPLAASGAPHAPRAVALEFRTVPRPQGVRRRAERAHGPASRPTSATTSPRPSRSASSPPPSTRTSPRTARSSAASSSRASRRATRTTPSASPPTRRSDNTQRCARFQGTKISQKDVEDLFNAAAQQGDPRAQARLLVAELNAKIAANQRTEAGQTRPRRVSQRRPVAHDRAAADPRSRGDDHRRQVPRAVGRREPAAHRAQRRGAGAFGVPRRVLARRVRHAAGLHVAQPRAAARLRLQRLLQTRQSFEELYQNFLASPWAYSQAVRYRNIIHTAINTQNWSLIGLQPPTTEAARVRMTREPRGTARPAAAGSFACTRSPARGAPRWRAARRRARSACRPRRWRTAPTKRWSSSSQRLGVRAAT